MTTNKCVKDYYNQFVLVPCILALAVLYTIKSYTIMKLDKK